MPAGILCLALSLAIKPHDAGLVWLYFLLAGGVYRKRALQTLLITAVLGLSAFLWVSHVAPHWMQDWQTNLATISAPGGINEPGPAPLPAAAPSWSLICRQPSVFFATIHASIIRLSYLICGALLLAWAVRTLRSSFSRREPGLRWRQSCLLLCW